MKEDFKKRFLDILFDSEEEEEIASGEMEDIRPKKVDKTLKAKDILYRNTTGEDNTSAFIDYEENKNIFETNIYSLTGSQSNQEEEDDNIYEPQPTISPIFGVVRKANTLETAPATSEVNESFVKKPASNHLGTVISPIYGYGESEVKEDNNEIIKKEFVEEEQEEIIVHDIQTETKQEEIKPTEVKLVFKENEKEFENHTLEDILEGFKDKTLVSDREINLFDDLFKEDE